MKAILLVVACGMALAVGERGAEACTCDSPTVCESVQRASVVFVGKVIEIKEVARDHFETRFAVEEVFRGAPGKTAVIHSRWDGASCDTVFTAGARMVVYAGGPLDQLRSICSRSQAVDAAAEDLAHLRALKKAKHAVVSGTVVLADDAGQPSTPRANATVRAKGTRHATRTDAAGAYRLELPPGKYVVEVDDPGTRVRSVWPSADPVDLRERGMCDHRNFGEVWNGRIRGRLVDHRGQPAAGVAVAVDGARRHVPDVQTDAGGEYLFEGVPEGSVVVGVSLPARGGPTVAQPIPTTYYPGVATEKAATRIAMPRAGLVEHVDLQLPPPLAVHPLTIRIVQGGAPAARRIRVTDVKRRDDLADAVPDPEGRLVVPTVAGPIEWDVCVIEARSPWTCDTVKRRVDRPLEIVLELPPPQDPP